VHTTGTDVPQHYTARAALTLGKDNVFRDVAQVGGGGVDVIVIVIAVC
jgi:hypothetical protein